jgi:hypothetical protein
MAHGTARDAALAQAWARHGEAAFSFAVLDRVKERADPDFDYEAELQALLALWRGGCRPLRAPLGPAMSAATVLWSCLHRAQPCCNSAWMNAWATGMG